LTNLLKAMLSFNPYCWSALHITWTHTFGVFMSHYSPQLVERWTCVSSPLLSHTPHKRRTCGSRGTTQQGVWSGLGSVSQLTYWHQEWTLVRFIFIFYFLSIVISIIMLLWHYSLYTLLLYMLSFFTHIWDACTQLCSLNPGVTCCHPAAAYRP
jgi:hypothetical protein